MKQNQSKLFFLAMVVKQYCQEFYKADYGGNEEEYMRQWLKNVACSSNVTMTIEQFGFGATSYPECPCIPQCQEVTYG